MLKQNQPALVGIVPRKALWPTEQKIVQKLSALQEYKKSLLKQKDLLKELFNSVLHKSFN